MTATQGEIAAATDERKASVTQAPTDSVAAEEAPAPPATRRRRTPAEKALLVLGDGAMFLAIGATLGVFGVVVFGQAAPSLVQTFVWIAAATFAIGGIALRARVAWAASTAAQASASALGWAVDTEPARKPLAALGPAAGFGVAAALLGSGVLASLAVAVAGACAFLAVFGAAAALAPQVLRRSFGVETAFGEAAARRLTVAVQAALWIIGAALVAQWLGAPTAAIFVAVGAVAVVVAVAARDHLRAAYSGWLLRSENKLRLGDAVDVLGDDGRPMLSGEVVALAGRAVTLRRADGARVDAPAALLLERPLVVRRARADAEPLERAAARSSGGAQAARPLRVETPNGAERASA